MKLHKFLAATALMLAVVLTLAPGAGAQGHFKVVYAFRGSDGQQPRAGLVFDVAGNLYLTTAAGGIGGCWFYGGYGCGTVVKLAPNPDGSWTESVLYTFTGGEDGGNPWSTLLFDAAGNLYGTTMYGGAYGNGAVFELSPTPDGSWTEGVLHSFIGADGAQPSGALTFDTVGNLYGTAENGGAYDHGALYTLTPNLDGTWTQQVLHSFTGGKDGARPSRNGALIFDAAGNLYGTAMYGGAYGVGVVFELTPTPGAGWKGNLLHTFRAHPGAWPACRLTLDTAGSLYGTTSNDGGDSPGVVFKLTPSPDGRWTYNILYRFKSGNDGDNPAIGVIFDAAGNLYGNTYGGGAYGAGTVFRLTPKSETILHTFTGGNDGANPEGFVFDAAGNFYGVTAYGGSGWGFGGAGVVFEITR